MLFRSQQFTDSNGNPMVGGKLYTYLAGTTTPATTYTSVSGVVANTNPITLDTYGRANGGNVWLDIVYSYKFVLTTSTGTLVATWDNITGVSNEDTDVYNVTDYGLVGDGVTDNYAAFASFAAIINAAAKGTVYFPPGDYYIGQIKGVNGATDIQWTNLNGVKFTGPGAKISIKGDFQRDGTKNPISPFKMTTCQYVE